MGDAFALACALVAAAALLARSVRSRGSDLI
jgi:hypothetical protein